MQGGNWTSSSCKHTGYISLIKSNGSVNADRTLMVIKKKYDNVRAVTGGTGVNGLKSNRINQARE